MKWAVRQTLIGWLVTGQESDELLLDGMHSNDKVHALIASLLADSIVVLGSPTREKNDHRWFVVKWLFIVARWSPT